MNQNTRVSHAIRPFSLKFSQVCKGVYEGHLAWVITGKTFRDATLAEKLAAQKHTGTCQTEDSLLPWSELPGLKVQNLPHLYEERQLAQEANKFCQECAA